MKELRKEIAQAKVINTQKIIESYNPCFLEYNNIAEMLLDIAAEMKIKIEMIGSNQTSTAFEVVTSNSRNPTIQVGYRILENSKRIGVSVYDNGVFVFIPCHNAITKFTKNRVKKALKIATM